MKQLKIMKGMQRLIFFYKCNFRFLKFKLKQELKNCSSFIELGCGVSSPAVDLISYKHTVGIDGYLPSLRANKKSGYFEDYILADLSHLPLRENSFDCVAAFDVLEHLTKAQAKQLISDMEKISIKKAVFLTPNGFNPKHQLEDGNPLQVHKHGWTIDEILSMGYTVFGIDGALRFRGQNASVTIKPKFLGTLISRLSDPFVYKNPTVAFQLFCIKNKLD
jgi:hypothetical protein